MAIDPLGKLAAIERDRAKYAESRGKRLKDRKRRRKRGPLRPSENLLVGELVRDAPNHQLTAKQVEQTAQLIRRPERTVMIAIERARMQLQERAGRYVDTHLAATEGALAARDFDVARKAAEWAITNISARDHDGTIERIIDKSETASHVPRVQIGIALGGLGLPTHSSEPSAR